MKTINKFTEPAIIVHGGAWDIPEELHQAHIEGIGEALQIGQQILKNTDDPVITVIEIIKYLEDNPTFDAGTGSFLNSAGEVEMDAGIMVGSDLSAGAVAAIQNVRHPIQVADLIRTKTQHVFLAGQGARRFAMEQGIAATATQDLLVGREKRLFEELQGTKKVRIKSFFEKRQARDTVGTVVINSTGKIVSATSTGGTPFKMQGRVGDSPLVGAGFYADDYRGGASTTGWGEGIMRVMLAKTAIDKLDMGITAQSAAQQAVTELKERVSGDGGIIIIDKTGRIGYAYNTPHMAVGSATLKEVNFISI